MHTSVFMITAEFKISYVLAPPRGGGYPYEGLRERKTSPGLWKGICSTYMKGPKTSRSFSHGNLIYLYEMSRDLQRPSPPTPASTSTSSRSTSSSSSSNSSSMSSISGYSSSSSRSRSRSRSEVLVVMVVVFLVEVVEVVIASVAIVVVLLV